MSLKEKAVSIINLIDGAKSDDYAKGVKDGIEGMLKMLDEAVASLKSKSYENTYHKQCVWLADVEKVFGVGGGGVTSADSIPLHPMIGLIPKLSPEDAKRIREGSGLESSIPSSIGTKMRVVPRAADSAEPPRIPAPEKFLHGHCYVLSRDYDDVLRGVVKTGTTLRFDGPNLGFARFTLPDGLNLSIPAKLAFKICEEKPSSSKETEEKCTHPRTQVVEEKQYDGVKLKRSICVDCLAIIVENRSLTKETEEAHTNG